MTVVNPLGVWGQSTTRAAFDSGAFPLVANEAIAVGDVVELMSVSSDSVPRVRKSTGVSTLTVGVALSAAAAGEVVYVRCHGPAVVKTTAAAVSAGQNAVGAAGGAAAASGSATEGQAFGVFVSGKLGGQDQAVVWVRA